jgi:hypothetical protein
VLVAVRELWTLLLHLSPHQMMQSPWKKPAGRTQEKFYRIDRYIALIAWEELALVSRINTERIKSRFRISQDL